MTQVDLILSSSAAIPADAAVVANGFERLRNFFFVSNHFRGTVTMVLVIGSLMHAHISKPFSESIPLAMAADSSTSQPYPAPNSISG